MLARYNDRQGDMFYRIYVTDCLYFHGRGMAAGKRFYELLTTPVETRDVEDIILDVIKKADLRVK